MYYDPVRSAYIDAEDGSVVLHEPQAHSALSMPSLRSASDSVKSFTSKGRSRSKNQSADLEVDIEMIQVMDLDANAVRSQLLELARIEKNNKKEKNVFSPTIALPPSSEASVSDGTASEITDHASKNRESTSSVNDDWIFARALQAMEFEISNEMIMVEGYEEGGDFNEKEYQASRSCKSQLWTLSAFICVIQVHRRTWLFTLSVLFLASEVVSVVNFFL